jgi:hypothetical protein
LAARREFVNASRSRNGGHEARRDPHCDVLDGSDRKIEIVMARYEDRSRKPSRSWTGDHELMIVIVTAVASAILCLLAVYWLPAPPEVIDAAMRGCPW